MNRVCTIMRLILFTILEGGGVRYVEQNTDGVRLKWYKRRKMIIFVLLLPNCCSAVACSYRPRGRIGWIQQVRP